jgi:hypothetical protein
MYNIKSMRYLFFVIGITVFWMFVPIFIASRFLGPLGGMSILISLVCVWYGAPKANAWLIHNSETFRVLWEWAREGEGD